MSYPACRVSLARLQKMTRPEAVSKPVLVLVLALVLAVVLVEVLVLVLKLVTVLVLGYRHVLSLEVHMKVLLFAAEQEHGTAALGPSACRSLVLVLGAASSSLAPV